MHGERSLFDEPSLVCVCDSKYCDEVEPIGEVITAFVCFDISSLQIKTNEAVVYTSNSKGQRLTKSHAQWSSSKIILCASEARTFSFAAAPSTNGSNVARMKITPSVQYQRILGFGCAFTDAFGIVTKQLPQDIQNKLLDAYWSDKGVKLRLQCNRKSFDRHQVHHRPRAYGQLRFLNA